MRESGGPRVDCQIKASDGRTLSFADYGKNSDLAVLCCHGGPGSRMEPMRNAERASGAEFRLIGIDRPGYGDTTPLPGRSIADWTGDALTIADHLGIEKLFCRELPPGAAMRLP